MCVYVCVFLHVCMCNMARMCRLEDNCGVSSLGLGINLKSLQTGKQEYLHIKPPQWPLDIFFKGKLYIEFDTSQLEVVSV